MPSTLTIARQRRHRRQQTRSSARQRSQRAFFGFGFIVSAVLVVASLGVALAYSSLVRGLPPVAELPVLLNPRNGQLLQPTRLYDRSGQHLLASLSPTDGPRLYALFDQFPPGLIYATVAAAQPDFWTSPGYVRSGWQDPQTHPTLAQDLVFNLLLRDRPASPLRAIHERMLAAQVTSTYGRDQVMEWYLNSADYGHYAYGAEAGAQLYLGKSVTQIDLSEAALLAAISQAPALNPIDAPKAAEQNRLKVIDAMLAQGMITRDQAADMAREVPATRTQLPAEQTGIAPAFVNLALAQLDAHFGAGRLERGGMVIRTSLDYDLQVQAACTLQAELARLTGSTGAPPANPDGSTCQAANLLPALQPGESLAGASASALVLDPQTGQVLAAVGDLQNGAQAAVLSAHPAGTSISPFIYLTGFSRGFNPASLGWDIPGSTPALGQVYHGPVRLRTALANDYIPPAAHLLDLMGQDSVENVAASFGLDLPSEAHLLQDDVSLSPLDLASAYAIFADSGAQAGQNIQDGGLDPVTVLQVTGIDHSIWADWTTAQTRSVVSPQLAYLMNQVLSDETARWPSLGHPNPLEIGRPAGAKLSHSLDLSAAWTIGYTPQRVAVVWLGTGSGAVTPRFSADIWHALMQYALRSLPTVRWDTPSGIVTVSVCDPSGMLPTAACPNVVSEVFLDGRQPVQADTLYQTFQVNAETGLLATVFTPPELVQERTYMVLPAEALAWAKSAGIPAPPSAYDTLQEPVSSPDVHITVPELFSDGRSKILVSGSAAGADFASYRLEYGQGLYPQEWYLVGPDSKTPVTEGPLGEWDTSGLNGLYALRLMVVRGDQRVDQAVVQVTLDNTPPQVAVTYPQNGQTVLAAQEPQLALQAQASDAFLVSVDFYIDDQLVGNSASAPFGVVWDAKAGAHTLRVVATDRAGNTAEATIQFSVK